MCCTNVKDIKTQKLRQMKRKKDTGGVPVPYIAIMRSISCVDVLDSIDGYLHCRLKPPQLEYAQETQWHTCG
jgi:hypothetical protein